ncbi:putative colanic acid biosynthesis acetyltransferase WcaF [Haloferula luteola]|uniref:Putative colanic acid biosynthesis acetyltransferase WcaF n=1 Tax=Haloferula luteola TaxID=595692 RepID=A0A840UYL8_9BACT|nr:putative colanic acid biosynthesis acetyltransferase [Haloferula luteola]MBB5350835.1 putative colanic acid biosynthesis acetyltransferase WcaF [Haloferula luteola]
MNTQEREHQLPRTTDVRHRFPLRIQVARVIWGIAFVLFYRPFAIRLFRKWRVLILRLFGAKVSWSATIHSNVKIWAPWNLEVGPFSCIGPEVDCYNQGKIVIGANSTISQKVYLCASSHDYTSPSHPLTLNPISIGSRVWVAADAFVGPGVMIDDGVVVGARAVVVKSLDSWKVFAGNPCKFVKERKFI